MIERTTQVEGQQVRYLEEGEGTPLILLHGASLGSSGDVFERNMGPLAKGGFRAIAPDRPGYGGSDGPGDRTPAGHRRFVLGLMDALGIQSAILVGHSQQATVAAQLALDQPNRVPRAVILGGGGALPPAAEGASAPDGEGERLTAEPTLQQVREILEANLYNKDLITPEVLEARRRMSVGRPFTFYSQQQGRPAAPPAGAPAGQQAEPIWQRVGKNPERFLLLYGRQDKPDTAARCERAQALFPKLNLQLLDRCSHMVQWDQQDTFERETLAFARAGAVAV